MDVEVFEQLHKESLLSADSLGRVKEHERTRLVSLHWDLRTLLYFSILLLTGGLGILLYKNVDTIGHATFVTLTGVLAAICMGYCLKLAAPFSRGYVQSPNLWFDYILLLGCALTVAFVGYLQFQYHVFGMRWGLAAFIPMLFLFLCAYFFDHIGVLSMAITNLGAWMGIAVTPLQLMKTPALAEQNIAINGVILGVLLHLLSWLSGRVNFKAHFAIVYKNFGFHVLFISLIACMADFDQYALWFLPLAAVAAYHIGEAWRIRSFYFMVAAVLYAYAGLSFLIVRAIGNMNPDGDTIPILIFTYFIVSGVALTMYLIKLNRKMKHS